MAKTLRYRMHPRGFLGVDDSSQPIRTPKPYIDLLNMHQFHVNTATRSADAVDPNPKIQALYAMWARNDRHSRTAEFREDVYAAAMKVFGGGTNGFYTWFRLQYDNRAAGDLHSRFLEDIIRFIETGRREMALETWLALISITDEGDDVGRTPDSIVDFFTKYNQKGDYPVYEVIARWCAQPTGFEDMLSTLYVLFGDVSL